MNFIAHRFAVLTCVLALTASPFATPLAARTASRADTNALANVEVLIVRHAERPDLADDLTRRGLARASAYVSYFQDLSLSGRRVKLTHLIAEKSKRTRLTLEPLSRATGLPLDTRFSNREVNGLADDLRAHSYGPEILICWHHGTIPSLIDALGGDSGKLIPGGKWPRGTYDWLVDLRFDGDGKLQSENEKLLHEHLMPGDSK